MEEEGKRHPSWRELLAKSMELGLGAIVLTKQAAQKLVDDMVAKGSVTKEQGKKVLDEMVERGHEQKEQVEGFVSQIVEKVLEKADLARGTELRSLAERLEHLEQRLSSGGH